MTGKSILLPTGWRRVHLRDVVARVERRIEGAPHHVLMISSREGFIPQSDRYSRFMAGESLKKYVELHDGEFAYNRGNSLSYPQGCVYQLRGYGSAAVPHVYFCFRIRSAEVSAEFLDHYFRAGGLNSQLEKRINSGVRNNGLMNIKAESFFDVQIPLPPAEEQRQIAIILTAVDESIAATEAVLKQLQIVKKSMMGDLLTRGLPGRHTRFKKTAIGQLPESWHAAQIGDLAKVGNGSTPSRQRPDYWSGGTIPWLPTGKVNDRNIRMADQFVTHRALNECPIRLLPPGTLLVAMIGQGKTRGMIAHLSIEATINQNFAFIAPEKSMRSWFLFGYLEHKYDELRGSARGSNQGALNCSIIKSFQVPVPPVEEQQKIESALLLIEQRIDAEQSHLDALAGVKSALVSVLLTGEVSVTPREAP